MAAVLLRRGSAGPYDSNRRVAAVDQKIAAGHKTCRVAGEKHRGAGDFVRAAEAAQQMLCSQYLARRGKGAVAVQRPLRFDAARRQRIDPDVSAPRDRSP